jgi:glycosyltransferase involved in cell wall biosynthesis
VISNIHQSQSAGLPFEEREGLLFVGSFNHPPNRDAVDWLMKDILPIVRRSLPDAPTFIVGSNPTPEVKAFADGDVEILGWVKDLSSLYARARLFVAPLRYGAGIKGKIGESAAYGLPVVSTSIGAEGLELRPEHEIVVADGTEAFAAAIVRLYNDPELWHEIASKSPRAIASQCSPAVVQRQLVQALHDLGAIAN